MNTGHWPVTAATAEGRIDSRACVVNMCVLGAKSCFRQNSVFHSINF